ncbi:NmrA family NAD(P)-binding protein [Robertkochia solimangrovi]|uniref:NmrA family NAD(P)-binding protein n=1 Tax=Robertkochia solimangrovi TaxID=2213046 RepID=UPI0011802DC6|nr:NmrA family NAD(P)-binding protein [Robertkochia solimangrovi]TRZ43982.1 NmrA family transcriptional regulator [Robertkochia solimangrovi]
MQSENILVLGGTGKTGRHVVEKLKALNHNVRIGSRTSEPSFDWSKPENWSAAINGMSRIYITYQPDLAVPGAIRAIEQLIIVAKQANIQKLVLLSGKGEREAELCEQVIIRSGINYTIIRASWFNQNFSESFLTEPIQRGMLALPQSHVKIPFVDTRDIAEVAVKVLTDDVYNGQIYQLTGPEALTFKEALEIIAKASGRSVSFIPVSMQDYVQGMHDAEVPDDFIWLIGYLFTEVLGNPENSEITQDIQRVLNRKPTTFAEYASVTAESGIWNPTSKLNIR